jgi:UDPglucose 6-dehydrogenase
VAPSRSIAAGHGPIGVLGLWHLGSVTAACLADAGYEVLGVDPDASVVEELAHDRPPVSEPGLAELLARNSARLSFTTDARRLAGARCAWVAFDTPVDDHDDADVEWVMAHALKLLAPLAQDTLAIVSSQLPSAASRRCEARCAAARGDRGLRFACVPENLRLGDALELLSRPRSDRRRGARGARSARAGRAAGTVRRRRAVDAGRVGRDGQARAERLPSPPQVAFANEIAAVCESVGADAAEVARGLLSERRIGPRAYLRPGRRLRRRDAGARHRLPARPGGQPWTARPRIRRGGRRERRPSRLDAAQAAGAAARGAPGAEPGSAGMRPRRGHRSASRARSRPWPAAGWRSGG